MNPIEISRSDSFQTLSKYLLKGQQTEFSVEKVLADITARTSVFDRRDIARALYGMIEDQKELDRAINVVLASDELVLLESDSESGERRRYSTWEMVFIERGMIEAAERMVDGHDYRVRPHHIENALAHNNALLEDSIGETLSDEQREAVKHVTGKEQFAVVAGLAGAGKSTMLAAAREAWEAQGYRVYGAALSGKAAEGLEQSSDIRSRTLASYEMSWKNGYSELFRGDVLVIDEAGMVGSRQLARFIGEAEDKGAKIVLVGDSEQLQAIGAGAPFRAIADRVGVAALENVIRQREDWQKEASKDLAQQRTDAALAAYDRHGALKLSETNEDARGALVRDYMVDLEQNPEDTRLVLTHRRVDVKALNQEIREARKERGDISNDIYYKAREGERHFSVGDRIIFLENNRDLNVKNGMLGTVTKAKHGQLTALLDGRDKRHVSVSTDEYDAFDHGYATTIHKSQGASVDRSFVLASSSMDRHLTYVSMTRHRKGAQLYAGLDEFKDKAALLARLGRAGLKETTLEYAVRPEDMSAEKIRKAEQDAKEAQKNKRVGWTHAYNLGNITADKAWKLMTATTDSADALKEAAGLRKSKKTLKPVYHFSITWPEEDRPSEKLQRMAVRESLRVLGLEDYQALAVQHLDRSPHVHVMLNLIHPETGLSASTSVKQANGKKASKLSYARRNLRKWANRFEKQHGLKITETSHKNIARRKNGEKVDARRKTRNVYEREKREGKSPLTAWLRKQENHAAYEIHQENRDMKSRYDMEFIRLNQGFVSKVEKLRLQKHQAVAKGEKEFGQLFQPKWTELKKNNYLRLKAFDQSERSTVQQFFNSVTTYFQVRKETESSLQGLYAATSSAERRALIQRWNKNDVRALTAQERMERNAYVSKIKGGFDDRISRTQKAYLRTDERLRQRQAKEAKKLRRKWQKYQANREENNQRFNGQNIDNAARLNQDKTVSRVAGRFQGQNLTPK